jgi:hypothetical protein
MTVSVYLDIGGKELENDAIFDRSGMQKLSGDIPYDSVFPFSRLKEVLSENAFDIHTADRYPFGGNGEMGLLVSDMHSPRSVRLLKAGLIAAISYCMESPLIAYRFYHRLERYSRLYPHVFYFRGMRERVTAPGTKFHTMHFPQSWSGTIPDARPWRDRDFLSMIASPKKAFPRRKVHNFRDLEREWIRRTDPWMSSDLYISRMAAVVGFAARPGFHLYGRGWDAFAAAEGGEMPRAVAAAWRGPASDKAATLSRYRFSLCYENSRFPGYVTEKIFDCFFGGTIPVYLGAPDILDFVPGGTFVDASRFDTPAGLAAHLDGMPEAEATRMLGAARAFLASDGFRKFHEDAFAADVLDALRDVARRKGLS